MKIEDLKWKIEDLCHHEGREGTDEGYLSRVIEKLIKQGLITRKQSRSDGRVFILSLSTKGERELLKINEEAGASIASMIEHLSPDEVNEILASMRRIQELLTREELGNANG